MALIAVEFETTFPAFTSPPGLLFPPFPPFPAVVPPLFPELEFVPGSFASASATASGDSACSGTFSSKMAKTLVSVSVRRFSPALCTPRPRESANANDGIRMLIKSAAKSNPVIVSFLVSVFVMLISNRFPQIRVKVFPSGEPSSESEFSGEREPAIRFRESRIPDPEEK